MISKSLSFLTTKYAKKAGDYYLKSKDFNGFPISDIDLPQETRIRLLNRMVRLRLVDVNFGDNHPNPHIKALELGSSKIQLEKLRKADIGSACLYPTKSYLKGIVNISKYAEKPFDLLLALGEPQLGFRAFDIDVLEFYRNDPRFRFFNDGVYGSIGVRSARFGSKEMNKRNNSFLQTFGYCFSAKKFKRAVAVYLRYLCNLSSEHQQIWKTKLLSGKYIIHPDYYTASMGEWPEKEPIFTAFLEEIHHINKMAELAGMPPLFKKEYSQENRPDNFMFLVRATKKEYSDFVHTLDKMLSENINIDFFRDDSIYMATYTNNRDGTKNKLNKGSIILLKEWVEKHFNTTDQEPLKKMVSTLKKIRSLRQSPAHEVEENEFNQKYFKMQRELISEAYDAIRTIRLIFTNFPNVRGVYKDVPTWLYEGKIRGF